MVEHGQTPRQLSSALAPRLRGWLCRGCRLQLSAVVILQLQACWQVRPRLYQWCTQKMQGWR